MRRLLFIAFLLASPAYAQDGSAEESADSLDGAPRPTEPVVLIPVPEASPAVRLCNAPWMDAERVQALLAVELGQRPAAGVHVTACSEDGAEVLVEFAPGVVRTHSLDLSTTAPGARSRLVALVIAELLRLGPPPPEPPLQTEAVPVVEGAPEPAPSPAADEVEEVEEVDTAEPVEASDDTPDTESAPEEIDDDAPNEGPRLEPSCGSFRGFGRRPCFWAVSASYGAAFHQLSLLGKAREGSLAMHQLRVSAQWRYLFGGVRIYGASVLDPAAQVVMAGGVTAFFGLEWWTRRWGDHILALRTGVESGLHGFQGSINACNANGCLFTELSSGEPTIGAFSAVRYEYALGVLRATVELELGWSRGFRIDVQRQLVTGLGGPWIALQAGLSIGKAER